MSANRCSFNFTWQLGPQSSWCFPSDCIIASSLLPQTPSVWTHSTSLLSKTLPCLPKGVHITSVFPWHAIFFPPLHGWSIVQLSFIEHDCSCNAASDVHGSYAIPRLSRFSRLVEKNGKWRGQKEDEAWNLLYSAKRKRFSYYYYYSFFFCLIEIWWTRPQRALSLIQSTLLLPSRYLPTV